MRNTRKSEAHLHTRKRARKREIVEVTEMADPKDLALEAPEAHAQGHVDCIVDRVAVFVGIVPVGQDPGRQRRAVLGGVRAAHHETAGLDGTPRRLAMQRMTREYVPEALRVQQL